MKTTTCLPEPSSKHATCAWCSDQFRTVIELHRPRRRRPPRRQATDRSARALDADPTRSPPSSARCGPIIARLAARDPEARQDSSERRHDSDAARDDTELIVGHQGDACRRAGRLRVRSRSGAPRGRVAKPTIQSTEVLVEVAAASVDRGTWHLMTGRPLLMRLMGFGFRRPKALNPGRSFAGTAVSVGDEVTSLRIGDAVYGTCDGSFAEFVAADESKVARKPVNLSFEQAATIPVSAVAAIQAVRDEAKLEAGQRALIIGASGGVGQLHPPTGQEAGAHATAVASTAKLDLVRELGADEVIDYTREDFAVEVGSTT